MSRLDDLSKKYLNQGIPFDYEIIDKARMEIVAEAIVQDVKLPLITAWKLRDMFILRVDFLKENLFLCDGFGTTLDDLELYKLGLLTPLVMIQISLQGYKAVVYSYQEKYNFSQKWVDFIMGQNDVCTDLINKGASWNKVFELAHKFDTSEYYSVGVLASEKAFTQIATS